MIVWVFLSLNVVALRLGHGLWVLSYALRERYVVQQRL